MMKMKINMREWQSKCFPDLELETKEQRELARLLTDNDIVNIMELKDGLSITANSFVGSVSLGSIHLNIMPKIQGTDLLTLMNYAYGLKDLTIIRQADFSLQSFTFADILIYQLYIHTEDLLSRGFHRGYIKKEEERASPKGRIDFNKIARHHCMKKATLPSRYYERNVDNLLNRVLLAGLKLSVQLAADPNLILHLRRLCSDLGEFISPVELTGQIIKRAQNNINRLTEPYRPLLKIIAILEENQSIEFEDGDKKIRLTGFFFDMNRFFEALAGRLLHDFAPGYTVRGQYQLHHMFAYAREHNPKNRRAPVPRPDFALLKNGQLARLMDAKYRDLWETPLPRDMLYQLSVYALSSKGGRQATIIYPTTNEYAVRQQIDIQNPVTGEYMGSVLLEPLHLNFLAKCLKDIKNRRTELARYVHRFVSSAEMTS